MQPQVQVRVCPLSAVPEGQREGHLIASLACVLVSYTLFVLVLYNNSEMVQVGLVYVLVDSHTWTACIGAVRKSRGIFTFLVFHGLYF